MPRRVNLPGAEELFRSTATEGAAGASPARPPSDGEAAPDPLDDAAPTSGRRLHSVSDEAIASGRVKHDEKMTVYVTADELMAVEQARLQLRKALGRTVDRGRFVRAAVAVALADLEARGVDSDVARRLTDS